MISATAEYALRAAVFLASRPSKPATVQSIARATKVPAGYLAKVMQDLTAAGLVNSQRGPGGGFSLARPAPELTVLDIVNAVDPVQRIRKCPLGNPAHATNLCPLHRRLDDAMKLVEEALGGSTVAELVDSPANRRTCTALARPTAPRIRR